MLLPSSSSNFFSVLTQTACQVCPQIQLFSEAINKGKRGASVPTPVPHSSAGQVIIGSLLYHVTIVTFVIAHPLTQANLKQLANSL